RLRLMEWNTITITLIVGVGAVIGFMAGMFGVGGGFLLVPLLNIFLGVPIPTAVGSVTCFILGPSTTAVLTRRPTTGILQLPLILLGGLVVGIVIGSHSLAHIRSAETVDLWGRPIQVTDFAVLSSYAVVMSGILFIAVRAAVSQSETPRRALFSHLMIPPVADLTSLSPSRHSIPLIAWTGLGVGFLSGFLGISGGLILIPILTSLMGIRVKESVTISIVIVWIVSFGSTAAHAVHGNIDLGIVMLLLLGGTVGARLGAEVGMKISIRKLRMGFAGVVAVSLFIVCGRLAQLWIKAGN
ncbi:MAG: sulfite exporter TauE/SafE family protein, partial [Planctomycetaceae bacterium]|nr:sulfite exporter TauE/SafE family protein [Planctomycetaceae bacterium]